MDEERSTDVSDGRPEAPGFAPLPAGRFVELPGRGRLFLREVNGPPGAPSVLLLHGLTSNADLNWFAAFEPLGQRYRVIAPDLRSHGDGIRPDRYRLGDVADDVAALVEKLRLEPSIVVGFSLGGAVAQLLWQRHRGAVAALVLCATAADYREASAKGRYLAQPVRQALGFAGRNLPAWPRQKLVDLAQRATVARVQPSDGRDDPLQRWAAVELLRSDPLCVAEAAAVIHSHTSERWVGAIDVPTAMVITGNDTVVPTDGQRELARLLEADTYEIDAGHGAFIENIDQFVPALLEATASVAHRLP